MVKHFNIIMAGVISGIVALFTSWLGVSGTVIGSVLSSFLYQLLSTYYDEKTKDIDFLKVNKQYIDRSMSKNMENNSIKKHKIAFIFPVIVILLVECLFCLTNMSGIVSNIFYLLEAVTDQNLFRVMGLALIVVSIYPFLKPKIIERKNGVTLFLVGVILFLRGIMDIHPLLANFYSLVLYRFDFILGVIICIALLLVIIRVLKPSKNSNNKGIAQSMYNRAKKVDTKFDNVQYNEYGNFNNDSNVRNNSQNRNSYVEDCGELLPIYEEDYIYVPDPNNPNRTIKKKILKKVNTSYSKPKRK